MIRSNFTLRTLLRSGLLLALAWLPMVVWAHPHVSVDIYMAPQFDSSGNLVAFEQRWRFDTFYSVVLIEEMDRGGAEGKARLLDDIITNLSRHEFYTRVRANGDRLSLADVDEFDLQPEASRVEFHFVLPLAEPVTAEQLQRHGFSYRVYEPTYYIEMLHAETDGILLNTGGSQCRYEIEKPEPTTEQLQRAVEVDEEGVPEDPDLGQHFAETVFIQCD
ncbi:DUF1007 family protein [Natronospirillum operosum]|uniref:DUF1007 family protein n=1 Tax=Natronospirillum operosum TaxID=2759953 RepID=A0A4Z0WE46_9GAMM|nr:DUF1007 family protein [Natronospirillum operosum]TGG92413.1 DUF1007 family protein [Natronospirillum operosum]